MSQHKSHHVVGVIGASGYAGGEVVRLIDDHPAMSLGVIAGHSSAGKALGEVHPHLPGAERVLISQAESLESEVELMFLALPHGASAVPAMALLDRGVKVVDLGSDFRLTDAGRYESAYGSRHPFPDQLGQWTYGLPEMTRHLLASTDRVAVPGCYPTSAILAMAPLVAAGLVNPEGIVVDSVSGASGAGRGAKANLSFGAIDEGVRAYGVGTHRHRPEMEQAIADWSDADIDTVRLSFTPHLVPMQRGILSTCSAPLTSGATLEEISAALEKAYADEPFVEVLTEPVSTRWVVGSNRCVMSAHVDDHTGRAIVIAAIDNLLKGAAGQAVQCANLMFGLPEPAGLPIAGWMP
ncbi:MAG: N-acetyl-gamma-glutamyl-phosphate reductase [bacterium]|nr:N-acetyl-gamma-glutamyl-phosphate reductase [bacterium]